MIWLSEATGHIDVDVESDSVGLTEETACGLAAKEASSAAAKASCCGSWSSKQAASCGLGLIDVLCSKMTATKGRSMWI